MDIPKEVRGFFDENNRLKSWPGKFGKQKTALGLIAEKFDADREYSATQVNEILNANHTFNDPAQLRRSMIEMKLSTAVRTGGNIGRLRKNDYSPVK